MKNIPDALKIAGIALVIAFAVALPHMAGAQTVNIKGVISARHGDQVTVTAAGGAESVITITDQTKVVETSGALNLQKTDRTHTELINGLPISADVAQDGAAMMATQVSYKAGDMKTARQIELATAQAKARGRAEVGELRGRMADAGNYDEKYAATVYFPTGSYALSEKAKADLMDLGKQAKGVDGYFISVTGYADTTGNPEANQKLSERRSLAVTRYLEKYAGVQQGRVLAPNAMGDAHQVGDTDSDQGKAQNRRVVAKVVVNKGLEGIAATSPNLGQAPTVRSTGASTSSTPQH